MYENPAGLLMMDTQYKSSDSAINLKEIFRKILNDPQFLSQQYEEKEVEQFEKKQDLVHQVMGKHQLLQPKQKEYASHFPDLFRIIFGQSSTAYRLGIQRIVFDPKTNKQQNTSFLTSLNIQIIKDLSTQTYTNLHKQNKYLMTHLIERINRNYRIDRIKNKRSSQIANKKIIEALQEGVIPHEIIQYVADIFETNILVFDFNSNSTYLYWCYSDKFPYFNLHAPLFVLYRDVDFYEPILCKEQWNTLKIYPKLLLNMSDITSHHDIKLSVIQYEQLDPKNENGVGFVITQKEIAMLRSNIPIDPELPNSISIK